jgi:O-antigen ligase
MAAIATIVVCSIIAWLYVLDRDEVQTSKALWIPVIYLLVISTRPPTTWFGMWGSGVANEVTLDGIYSASPTDLAVQYSLLTLGVVVIIARASQVGSLLWKNVPVLLFYIYGALSMLWSDFPLSTLKHWVKGVTDLLMVLIVLTDYDPVIAVKRLLTRVGFILLPISPLLGIYYPTLGRTFTRGGEAEFVGVSTQKNGMGMVCFIFGLGCLWCFLRAYRDRQSPERNRQLLAHGTMLGFVVWNLLLCASLTSKMCLVLAGTVMVLASRLSPNARLWRVYVLAAAALFLAAFPVFFAPALFESFGRNSTLSGRTEIWDILPTLVRQPLLGAGYETFLMGPRLVWLRHYFDVTFQEAHNGYLEVYLNLGWIGVSLFALLVITGCRKIVAGIRRDPDIASLGLAFLIAVLIQGLAEAPFRNSTPTWFFLMWGIAAASNILPSNPIMRTGNGFDHVERLRTWAPRTSPMKQGEPRRARHRLTG